MHNPDKAKIYAQNLIQNISNEKIKRKQDTNRSEHYSVQEEDLQLFKQIRYLGSLRCLLDRKNMQSVYNA